MSNDEIRNFKARADAILARGREILRAQQAAEASAQTISIKELMVGDIFETKATARKASTDGTITAIGRTKFTYEAVYMGRHPVTITTDKTDLIGGKIRRGDTIYNVTA